jgi:hypothetical protein
MDELGGTRTERVVLETARHQIIGDITLPRDGYANRLSDLLNREGINFILLTNALVGDLNGGAPDELDFIAVARDHVQLAYEASERPRR